MTAMFTKILDMSLTASIVILAVTAVRYLLRSAPKGISYALWSVVLFRLLCPISLTAPLSLLEVVQPEVTVVSGERTSSVTYLPKEISYVPAAEDSQTISAVPAPVEEEPQPEKLDMMALAAYAWAAGVSIMVLHSLVSYWQLRRRLVGATPFRDRVYFADHIPTPFVLGILSPRIYLPSNTPARERQYILAHEEHHIHRLDHITKVLAYGALCLHWFNPLVWAAFFLAGKDMEMSCDEAVIRKLGPENKADYAQTLLRLATHRPIIAGTPLAFGDGDTKGRVIHLAKWKKSKVWVIILSIALCAVVLFLCAVNPGQKEEKVRRISENGFTFVIPWDYRMEYRNFQTYLMRGSKEAGCIRSCPMPDLDANPYGKITVWAELMDIPELQDGKHEIVAELTDDNAGCFTLRAEDGRHTEHHFFFGYDRAYEIWFDTAVVPQQDRDRILESIYYQGDSNQYDKIGMNLPENMTELEYGRQERRFFATEPMDDQGNEQLITDAVLGGVQSYETPKHPLLINETQEWLRELGVPQLQQGVCQWTAKKGIYGDLQVTYVSDSGEETIHDYYIGGHQVFEVWFDAKLVDPMTRSAILESVYFASDAKFDQILPSASLQPSVSSDVHQNIGLSIPGDLDTVKDGAEILFYPRQTNDSAERNPETAYGGIRQYTAPEGNLNVMDAQNWLRELGVRQIIEGGYDWMASGSDCAQMEVSFADASHRETKHYYFIQGDSVFELWVNTSQIDAMTRAAMTESVYFAPDAKISSTLPLLETIDWGKNFGLNKCRAFLEAFQKAESYSVVVDRQNFGGPFLNDSSKENVFKSGENWLRFVSIPQDGYLDGIPVWESRFGEMYVDGQFYDNMENSALTENREVQWGKTTTQYQNTLWFQRFDWDAQEIQHKSTLPAGKGEAITLQVMAPYYEDYESLGIYDYYFVEFIFDENDSFVRAEITTFFNDPEYGDFSCKETLRIDSMKKSYVEEVLQHEYNRALTE